MTLKDIGNSIQGFFTNASSFVAQNPTPASFIGKQIGKSAQEATSFLQKYPTPMSFVSSTIPKPIQAVGTAAQQTFKPTLQAFTAPQKAIGSALMSNFIYNPQSQRLFPQSPIYDPPVAMNKKFSAMTNQEQDQLLQNNLNLVMGMAEPLKTVGKGASLFNMFDRKAPPLTSIRGLGRDLARKGYTSEEIAKMVPGQAQKILTKEAQTANNQIIAQRYKDFARDMEEQVQNSSIDVKKKVGIIDYLRTPDRVLNKIGLGEDVNNLRKSWDAYKKELPQEIERITKWSQEANKPGSNERIFQWLDGNKGLKLDPTERKVALEIQSYLTGWAERLKLPVEKRISNYITHIFEKGSADKEWEVDPEVAAIMREKVAKSVYDPFLQKRVNKPEYIQDTWRALDAYVKRATRKANLDPVLDVISKKSEGLEDSQFKYVKGYIDRVNMRPTDVDNAIDNSVKQIFGYRFGQRPTTAITQKTRQMVFRGTLGLNPASALKNLSQGANTYSELGEKYTMIGYWNTLKNMRKFLTGADTELERVGVLQDNFIQDRQLSAIKSFWQKADESLFYMFNMAEKINRGAAYFGAKAKGLNKGMSEEEAIAYAKEVVRKTQFTFGSIDTPVVLQSDIAKTLGQFMSYSVKQGEFLGEKIAAKDVAGLVRYTAASLLFISTVGKLFGMEWKDMIPTLRLGVPPTLQGPYGLAEVALGTPDKYGKEADPNPFKRLIENQNVRKGFTNYIPAGNQIFNKTLPGLEAYNQGFAGKPDAIKWPVEQNTPNFIKSLLLGQYSTPESQEYYAKKRRPLSNEQSEAVRSIQDHIKQLSTYNEIQTKRAEDKVLDQVRDVVEKSGVGSYAGRYYVYWDSKQGKTFALDTEFEPETPRYTGAAELDKELRSDFLSDITKKKNIITNLYRQGQLSQEEAEKQLLALEELKKTGSTAKKGRSIKLSLPKEKAITIPPIKLGAKKNAVRTLKLPTPPPVKIRSSKSKRNPFYELAQRPIHAPTLKPLGVGARLA